MTIIPWAEWRPDASDLNSAYLRDLMNVLCADGKYIPFAKLAPFTDPVPEAPFGGITVKDSSGTIHVFAGGATKLYKLNNSTLAWDHVSKLGADQATNGGFGADTDWTKDSGVTISGGAAHFTSVADGDGLSQSQSFTAGTIYKVEFTVSNHSGGAVKPILTGGTQVDGDSVSANGTYTQYLTAVSGNNAFELQASGTTTLDIDDVSVEPLANYAATSANRWWFIQFGNYVVAGNINDSPQYYELGVSAEFVDLPGSPGTASAAAIWGDHLALLNGRTVKWSNTNDIGEWTTGNAGSQTFPDGGEVLGSSSATNPIIFQESAIRFGTFVPGSTVVFTFDKIHDKRGAASQYAIASRGEFTFFNDSGSFFRIYPDGQIEPIGFEKVDRTVLSSMSGPDLADMVAAIDPFYNRIYYAVRINSTDAAFDRILIYDWGLGRWTQAEGAASILFPLASGTIGYTLEGLNALYASIDEMDISLDSRVWQGGTPVLAAFDESNRLGFFTGENAEATLTTAEVGDTAGAMTFLDSIYPVVDTNDVFISVGSRNRRGDTVVWSDEIEPTPATGRCDYLNEARFHQFRMRVPEAAEWSATQGVDIDSGGAGSQ